jgi:biotin carboxylase
MLLFSSQSYRVDAFVAAATNVGVELVLATDLPAPFKRLGPPVIGADFTGPEAAASKLADAAKGAGISGLIPTNETTAVIAALAAERLGLPHNSAEAVHRTRDKRQMRERLMASGVPSPTFRVVEPHEQARDVLPDVRFPAVVKPSMLTGSQGVIRVDDAVALEHALHRVRAILASHGGPARDDAAFHRILVEAYLPGAEVSLEGLMTEGRLDPIAIFDKPDPLTGPFFEETIYVTPSRLPCAQQRELVRVAERAANALGLTHGPVHVELRTTPEGGSFIVELAARSIGGLCSRVFAFVAGSLEELLLAHACGLSRVRVKGSHGAAGVMMIPIPRSGVLRGVTGLDEARAIAGIESVKIGLQSGESIRALPEGDKYLGFIFARGESPDEVEAALRTAHAALSFELSPLLEIVDDGGLGARLSGG